MTLRVENLLLLAYALVVLGDSIYLAHGGGPLLGALLCCGLCGAVVVLHVRGRTP